MSFSDGSAADMFFDHARVPFHRGKLVGANAECIERSTLCGDEVHLQLHIAGTRVTSAWYMGRGCIVSQASASMLCQNIDGRSLDAVSLLTEKDALEMIVITVSPVRRICALLAFRALRQILAVRAS